MDNLETVSIDSLMNQTLNEVIDELWKMDIDDLEEFRSDMVHDLTKQKMPEFVIDFIGYMIDRVIVEKFEEMMRETA